MGEIIIMVQTGVIMGQFFNIPLDIFEFFRIVPIEEISFRGLGIEIILLLEKEEFDYDGDDAGALIYKNRYFIIGGISNSIMFGLLHFRAYPDEIYPIIYLILLALVASFLRFKYGLFASMMLHGINNILASAFAIMIW